MFTVFTLAVTTWMIIGLAVHFRRTMAEVAEIKRRCK